MIPPKNEYYRDEFLKKRKYQVRVYSIVGTILLIVGAILFGFSIGQPVGYKLIIGILSLVRSTYMEVLAYGFRQDIKHFEAPEDL